MSDNTKVTMPATPDISRLADSSTAGRPQAGRRGWTYALAVGGLLIAVGALGASHLSNPKNLWLLETLATRQFLTAAAVFLASAIGTIGLCALLWRVGGPYRRGLELRLGDQGGAVIVEFALVLPFLLMLALIMAQSAALMAGNIAVNYSAFCAARSAVVNVPLELANEPANALAAPAASTKLNRIKDAAVWAITPVSCPSSTYPTAPCADLQAAIDLHMAAYNQPRPVWLDNTLPHRLQYAKDNTTVTIRAPANGMTYEEHEDLVADVSHVFYLGVPFAGRVLSGVFGDDGRTLGFAPGQYGVVINATSRLPNEGGQDYVDIEKFP